MVRTQQCGSSAEIFALFPLRRKINNEGDDLLIVALVQFIPTLARSLARVLWSFSIREKLPRPREALTGWRRSMRCGAWFGGVLIGIAQLSLTAYAQAPDDSLKIYAVTVVRTPPLRKQVTGDGIYLGHGLVISAAHVVGRWPFFTHPRVLIGGQELPVKVIKEGSFPNNDLALLSVDDDQLPVSLRLRRNPLCQELPRVGEEVIDVTPQELKRSKVISPLVVAPNMQTKFNTLIDAPQSSGSGIFDDHRKCLVGIVSGELPKFHYQRGDGHLVWTTNGLAGYFVSAEAIAKFIPPSIHY
jgi:hypothetical protein